MVRKESKNYLQSNPITRLSMMVLFYVDNMAAWFSWFLLFIILKSYILNIWTVIEITTTNLTMQA